MRVLACGGRDFAETPKGCPTDRNHEAQVRMREEQFLFDATMDTLAVDHGVSVVIHGDCPTGADRMADWWARRKMIPVKPYPARWDDLETPPVKIKHRKGRPYNCLAGFARNQRMLDEGKPDLVVAFPGGRGTADMLRRAKAAGVKVIEVPLRSGRG